MNKILLTTTVIALMTGTSAIAHHPAEDIVDPDIYAMIDENVSDAHAEMVFDDMGRDLTDAGASGLMSGDMGADMGGELMDSGAMDTREEMASMEMNEQMGDAANDSRGLQER